jgi:predicted AAA+ superfamily ATPase
MTDLIVLLPAFLLAGEDATIITKIYLTYGRLNDNYGCMIDRPYWKGRIRDAWQGRPLVWLAGVRRVGKTTLAHMLPYTTYLNGDLPSAVRRLEDPEFFYESQPEGATIVLDEVHRLADPSQALKIAADEFSHLRILATGSSTLAATRKFRDTLTGRKAVIVLPPVLWPECQEAFGIRDLDLRLLHGGLPEQLLAKKKDDGFYAEWMDSFYARDIQELFGIRDRTGFLNLLRLLLRQSGGLLDYSALSRECDLSRPTVKAHVEALRVACAIHLVRPLHGGGRRELIRRPKAYGFDTGFVTFVRGWQEIRDDDRGLLWEHLVLDVLRASVGSEGVFYWRNKSGREVDFVVRQGRQVHTIECKIRPERFNPETLQVFRQAYPHGHNYLVCPGISEPYKRRAGDLTLRVVGCGRLMRVFGD